MNTSEFEPAEMPANGVPLTEDDRRVLKEGLDRLIKDGKVDIERLKFRQHLSGAHKDQMTSDLRKK